MVQITARARIGPPDSDFSRFVSSVFSSPFCSFVCVFFCQGTEHPSQVSLVPSCGSERHLPPCRLSLTSTGAAFRHPHVILAHVNFENPTHRGLSPLLFASKPLTHVREKVFIES